MRRLLSVIPTLALAACVAGEPEGARPADEVSELSPPAGVGSGEPFLSTSEDAVVLSWLEADAAGGHVLWMAPLSADGWGERRAVARSERFFVNWADFPSVIEGPDGSLWAHWLERGDAGGYDYGVRVVRSADGGATWSEPWTPHEDGTPTEHGFVSLFPVEGGMGLTWLDGRKYASGPHGEPTREMTVRFRSVSGTGEPGPETLLDARVCDCCQTDAALAGSGPVVVYRDRTEDEVRDIYVTRWTPDGWTPGVPVHEDGWVIGGCPVNGPAVAAAGDDVAVAWFTGAQDDPRVQVAWSRDGGATFEPPQRVDGGAPAGRVDLLLRADGAALVSWMERTGGEGAEVRMRVVPADAPPGPPRVLTRSSSARASGFPRMALLPWAPGTLVLAWTDASGPRSLVRVLRAEVP